MPSKTRDLGLQGLLCHAFYLTLLGFIIKVPNYRGILTRALCNDFANERVFIYDY